MAIAGVLLLTGTATYVVLKWRIIIPYLLDSVQSVSDTAIGYAYVNRADGSARRPDTLLRLLARPTLAALLSGATAICGIMLDDSFTGKPSSVLVCMHVTLFAAVASLAFPRGNHWSVSTTTLAAVVAAYYAGRTKGVTQAGFITLWVLNFCSCTYNIFIEKKP